ncbi:MAG: FlgD immunoglobulin-like domain containing protein [Candidatus Eisenbacteria bacterium]
MKSIQKVQRHLVLGALLPALWFAGTAHADGLGGARERGEGVVVVAARGGGGGADTLRNHDGTMENGYVWLPNGSESGAQGAFAECFHTDSGEQLSICSVRVYLTQIGDQAGQTLDLYVWDNGPTDDPGTEIAHVTQFDPGPVAQWPAFSVHDIPINAIVSGDWWVGWRGNWNGGAPGWLAGADETGGAGCPLTFIGPGRGFPVGWESTAIVPSMSACRSFGIEVVGTPLVIPPPPDCGEVLANHDATWESAYGWIPNGLETGEQGAFAECFHTDDGQPFRICELQFTVTRTEPLPEGTTMDVYVWSNGPTGDPGQVLLHLADLDPGVITPWPAVNHRSIPVDLQVSGDWWVGWRANGATGVTGLLIAGDETGGGGCPRTLIGPGQGFPAGWENVGIVPAWSACRGLGIRTVGSVASSSIPGTSGEIQQLTAAPNPFGERTRLAFGTPRAGHVRSGVYDAAGRLVRTLADGNLPAGRHELTWDGRNDADSPVPAGIYWYRVELDGHAESRRVVRVR